MSCYLNSYHNCKNVQAFENYDNVVHFQLQETDKASVNTSCQAVSYLTCHVTMG